ncbi:unnamed protein product [Gemmata massiliana]|uniref:Uncharacterized protein n=1 Tax=Gemmata massiliana TaxID=1210884 RepID=A0A6P2DM09_9BACT|nr:unnamed protein product [Gemmata massiliana]
MKGQVILEVGKHNQVVEPSYLPPVGTRIHVHKNYTSDYSDVVVEVIEHEWFLIDGDASENRQPFPEFSVRIKTRVVSK